MSKTRPIIIFLKSEDELIEQGHLSAVHKIEDNKFVTGVPLNGEKIIENFYISCPTGVISIYSYMIEKWYSEEEAYELFPESMI